jgi:predicted nucleic acid-binding protein
MIQQEKIQNDKGQITEDRYSMCRSVVQVAEKGQIEIATSTLSLAEVNKNPAGTKPGEDKIAAYFERDYVLIVNLDTAVGERARALMQSGFAGLRPADACHLAAAISASAEEFHTFDTRLLNLNGLITKLDGTKLAICKPDPGGHPMPLLDALAKQPDEATTPVENPPGVRALAPPQLGPSHPSVAASERQPVAAHSEEPKRPLPNATAPKPPT